MSSLTNEDINESYQGLLKTIDNKPIGLTSVSLSDGLGNPLPIQVNSSTFNFTGTVDFTSATISGLTETKSFFNYNQTQQNIPIGITSSIEGLGINISATGSYELSLFWTQTFCGSALFGWTYSLSFSNGFWFLESEAVSDIERPYKTFQSFTSFSPRTSTLLNGIQEIKGFIVITSTGSISPLYNDIQRGASFSNHFVRYTKLD